MGRTLGHRLDDACERCGLEWVVLPFDESRESWRDGPYWGALLTARYPRRSGHNARFYLYTRGAQVPYGEESQPDVVFITIEPAGRHEIKRLLLAQIESHSA
jgi:hypothetical protein